MKKTAFIVFLALFSGIFISGLQAQVYDINLNNLPQDAAFRKRVDKFSTIYRSVAAWSPEWKAKMPKAKAVILMESLLNDTRVFIAKNKSDNPDLLLFRTLLKCCLYNAHLTNYHKDIVKN